MTYRELIDILKNQTPSERLDDTVTVYYGDTDAFFTINRIYVSDPDDGILHDGQLYLTNSDEF